MPGWRAESEHSNKLRKEDDLQLFGKFSRPHGQDTVKNQSCSRNDYEWPQIKGGSYEAPGSSGFGCSLLCLWSEHNVVAVYIWEHFQKCIFMVVRYKMYETKNIIYQEESLLGVNIVERLFLEVLSHHVIAAPAHCVLE